MEKILPKLTTGNLLEVINYTVTVKSTLTNHRHITKKRDNVRINVIFRGF
jgi:hypothetical protein